MAHTPGPWTIEYETEDGEPYDDGVRIDSPEGPVAFNVIDCSAHLIAAAPDMLAACRQAVSAITYLLSNDDDDPNYADTLNTLAAAIAKAEGRADDQ